MAHIGTRKMAKTPNIKKTLHIIVVSTRHGPVNRTGNRITGTFWQKPVITGNRLLGTCYQPVIVNRLQPVITGDNR